MTGVATPSGSPSSKATTDRSSVASLRRRGRLAPVRATVVVVVVGLLITLSASWTAWTLNRHNEHNLLEVQTRQASALLSASILSLSAPLETALEVENATGGDVRQFSRFVSTSSGPGSPSCQPCCCRGPAPCGGQFRWWGSRRSWPPSRRRPNRF